MSCLRDRNPEGPHPTSSWSITQGKHRVIILRVVVDRPLDLTSADDRSDNDPYPEMIKEVHRESTKVIEDFDRGMNYEALCIYSPMRPVRSHFLNLSIVDPQDFSVEQVEQGQVEQELLFGRLKPVKTGSRELNCMDSTRQSLLDDIIDWVPNKLGHENVLERNAYCS